MLEGGAWRCVECNRVWIETARLARRVLIFSAMGGQCFRCDESRMEALTLHHRDPSDRSRANRDNNPTLWARKVTVSTWAEVWLCDLLCASCHHCLHGTHPGTVWDYTPPVALP